MEASSLFQANEASKKIAGVPLLKNINLQIAKGQHLAIIGHNGSGKSSLLKLIAGIYEPTSGTIERTVTKITYVPEHFPETIRFKMKEYLVLVGQMSGLTQNDLNDKIMDYAKIFLIEEFLETPLKNCSKGTKQKAGIIQALIGSPDLLLLDEPLSGLDQASQNEFIHQLIEIKDKVTIVFTAHEQLLINKIAKHLVEMKDGQIASMNKINKESKLMAIKAITYTKEAFLHEDRVLQADWENGVVSILVEASYVDQLLLQLLHTGASIIEVKEVRE